MTTCPVANVIATNVKAPANNKTVKAMNEKRMMHYAENVRAALIERGSTEEGATIAAMMDTCMFEFAHCLNEGKLDDFHVMMQTRADIARKMFEWFTHYKIDALNEERLPNDNAH